MILSMNQQTRAGHAATFVNDQAQRRLEEFRKGEKRAVDAYHAAMERLASLPEGDADQSSVLRQIAGRHQQHAQLLQRQVEARGGAVGGASSRGLREGAMVTSAGQFGGCAMLRSLKEAEKQNLTDYLRGVDDLDAQGRELLWKQLIPATERHVDLLEELLSDRSPASL